MKTFNNKEEPTNTNISNITAQRLKNNRINLSISQQEMSADLGISKEQIQNYESGARKFIITDVYKSMIKWMNSRIHN